MTEKPTDSADSKRTPRKHFNLVPVLLDLPAVLMGIAAACWLGDKSGVLDLAQIYATKGFLPVIILAPAVWLVAFKAARVYRRDEKPWSARAARRIAAGSFLAVGILGATFFLAGSTPNPGTRWFVLLAACTVTVLVILVRMVTQARLQVQAAKVQDTLPSVSSPAAGASSPVAGLSPELYPFASPHTRAIDSYFESLPARTGTRETRAQTTGLDIILCFTNRCGSNLLAEGLYATKRFPLCDEILNNEAVILYSKENDLSSYDEYISRLRISQMEAFGIFGLKAGSHQLFHLAKRGIIPRVLPKPRFILTFRQDTLAQAVSYWIADQTGAWTSRMKGKPHPPKYDAEKIIDRMRAITRSNALFEYFFALHGIAPIRVCYETLCSDFTGEVSRVCLELGIEPAELPKLDQIGLKKQGGTLNEEFIARFKESFYLEGQEPLLCGESAHTGMGQETRASCSS